MLQRSIHLLSTLLQLLMLLQTVMPKTITQYFSYAVSGADITSPNFPLPYDFDENVYEYVIETKQKSKSYISLTFSDFNLDSALSTLKIYDGKTKDNPPTSSWTGARPPMYISSGSILTLIFKPGSKQSNLKGSKSIGFKVHATFHGDVLSRRSSLIGWPEIPRLVPLNGFCGLLHTTLDKHSHVALSGGQMSPQLSHTIGENSFIINCFWSRTVLSQLFYVSIKSTLRARKLYQVSNGRTSEGGSVNTPATVFSTNITMISTYQLNKGSFYIKLSGLLKSSDYFAFSFATSLSDSVSIVKGLQKPNRTRLCPFKSCAQEGWKCVWDWSICPGKLREVQDSPDCDEQGVSLDIKSCFPPEMKYSEKVKLPKRCYRKSVDACDDFYDCPEYREDEKVYCPKGFTINTKALAIWLPMGFVIAIALCCLLLWKGCCTVFFKCIGEICDCCKGCWDCICEDTCMVSCRKRLRHCGPNICSRIRGCCQAVRRRARDRTTEVTETHPAPPSQSVREPQSPDIRPGREPGPETRGLLTRQLNETPPVVIPETPPLLSPTSDQRAPPPTYDQVAPAYSTENLPSYTEAVVPVREPVVSDGTRPPPRYDSVW